MERSPYKTPWRLYAEKTGLVLAQSLDNNPLIRAGIEEESNARQRFEEQHAVLLLPLCGESERYPLLRASFDGLSEANEPVEIKCPHETTFLDVLLNREQSVAYQLYWCQVQQQILVAEAERGFLYFYHQGQAVEFVLARDEVFLTQLIATAMDFWSALQSGKEPDKDPERDLFLPQGPAEPQWQQWAAHYRQNDVHMDELKVQLKALDVQQAKLEQQLVGMMGEYRAAEHSGLRVNRFQVQGAIDYKAACQTLLPEVSETTLASYRKKSSDRVRITCREDNGMRAEVPFDAKVLKDLAACDYWF
jgi:putative phage-type endonuclease